MFKRILSMLLSIVMVISLLPLHVFAEEAGAETTAADEVTKEEWGVEEDEWVSGSNEAQAAFDAALVNMNGGYYMTQDITITGDVTFDGGVLFLLAHNSPASRHITIADGGKLTICAGNAVPIQHQGSITVENGGTLVLEPDASMDAISGGSLIVRSGGSLIAPKAYLSVGDGSVLTVEKGANLLANTISAGPASNIAGIPNSQISVAGVPITITEERKNAIADYADYAEWGMYVPNIFTITESITLPETAWVSVIVDAELTIGTGVTFTNNGMIMVSGTLINNGTLDGTGTMSVRNGTFIDNSAGQTPGGGTTGGEGENPEGGVTANSFAELVEKSVAAGHENVYVRSDVTVTGDYDLKGMSIYVDDGATLTVTKGVTLTVDQYIMVSDGSAVVVEMGAVVQIAHENVEPGTSYSSAGLRINGGTVRIDEGGTLVFPEHDEVTVNSGALQVYGSLLLADGRMVNVYYYNGAEVYGLDVENIVAYVKVSSREEMNAAMREYGTCGHLNMYAVGEFTIDDYVLLITRASLVIDGSEEFQANVTLDRDKRMEVNGEIVVRNGGLLTGDRWSWLQMNENSYMVIQDDGTVHILVGAHLVNDGGRIVVYDDYNGKLIIDGDFANRDENGLDGTISKTDVKTVADFEALMSENDNRVTITDHYIFTEQPGIYSDDPYITIAEGGSITLAEGITWRVGYGAATIRLEGGTLTLEKGAFLDYAYYGGKNKWVNNLWVESGRLEVFPTATVDILGDYFVNLDNEPEIVGIPSNQLNVSKTCTTEAQLREMLANEQGYEHVSLSLSEPVDLYENMDIPETCSVTFQSGLALHEGVLLNNWGSLNMGGVCNVYSGAEIQNNGTLTSNGTAGSDITVHAGGKIQNNSKFNIYYNYDTPVTIAKGATLHNDGTISGSSGYLNAFGTLSGSGTIDSYRVTVNYSQGDEEEEGVTSVYTPEELDRALESGATEIVIKRDMEIAKALAVVDAMLRIPEGVVVTNRTNITMEDNAELVVEGVLVNANTVDVMGGTVRVTGTGVLDNQNNLYVNDGTVDVEGAWEGNGANVNMMQPDENLNINVPNFSFVAPVYSMEELVAVLNMDRVLQGAPVTVNIFSTIAVNESMEIPGNVLLNVIGDGNDVRLIVLRDAELILNGPSAFNDAKLEILPGGSVINRSEMVFNNLPYGLGGGNLDGWFENFGTLWVNTGSTVTIAGNAVNWSNIHVGFGGEESNCQLKITGSLDNYGYLNITPDGILSVTGYLCNGDNENGVGFIQQDGPMNVSGQLINSSFVGISVGNVLNVTGTYEGSGPLALNIHNENAQVNGVGEAVIQYHYPVDSYDTLLEALAYAEEGPYEVLFIDNQGEIIPEGDVELPANVTLYNSGLIELSRGYDLVVNGTLMNEGQLDIWDGNGLYIQEEAILHNNRGILVRGGIVNVAGEYVSDNGAQISVDVLYGEYEVNGNVPIGVGAFVDSYEDLVTALDLVRENGYNAVLNITDSVTLEDSVQIPSEVRLCVVGDEANKVELTVPSGVTLDVYGPMMVRDAMLITEEGSQVNTYEEFNLSSRHTESCGAVIRGNMANYGWISVANGAFITVEGYLFNDRDLYVEEGDERKSLLNITGEMRNAGWVTVSQNGTLRVSGNMENKAGIILFDGGFADVEGYFSNDNGELSVGYAQGRQCALKISGELLNLGSIVVEYNGEVQIPGGKLVNARGGDRCGCINLGGEMGCGGTIENDGEFHINYGGNLMLDPNAVMIVNNTEMFIEPESSLTVNGALNVLNSNIVNRGAFWVNYNGTAYFNGNSNLESYSNVFVGFGPEEEDYQSKLEIDGGLYNYGYFCVEPKGNVYVYGEANLSFSDESWSFMELRGQMAVSGALHNYAEGCITGILNVDGYLENEGNLTVDGGALYAYGDYSGGGAITRIVNTDSVVVAPGYANVQSLYRVGSLEELKCALELAYTVEYLDVEVTSGFRIDEYLEIPQNVHLNLWGLEQDVCITVGQGNELWVYGGINVNGGTQLIVEEDAVLYNNGHIQVNGGTVIVDGLYASDYGHEIYVDFYESGQVQGAPSLYQVNVDDFSQLYNILTVAEELEGAKLIMDVYGSFAIDENIHIPENVVLNIGNWNWISIVEGVTVDNYGYIEIRDESVLHNAGVLNNYGTLIIREYCTLENEGELNGNAPLIYVGGGEILVNTEEELRTAVENPDVWGIVLRSELVLSQDLQFMGKRLRIEEGGFLTVPGDVTLTLEGDIEIFRNGILHVREGGCLRNYGFLYVDGGALQVPGTYEFGGEIVCVLSNDTSFISISGDSWINYVFRAESYYDLIACAAIASQYEWLNIEVFNDITVTSNLTLPENTHINLYGQDMEEMEFVVRSGATLTLNGGMHVGSNARLTVMNHATLYNNADIHVNGGVVDVQGEYTSDSDRVITVDIFNGEVNNAPYEFYASIDSFEMLYEVLWYVQNMDVQAPVWLDLYGDITIWENITIPENVTFNPTNGWDTVITVPEDRTVTNYGYVYVTDGATLVVDGTMDNQGRIQVRDDANLVLNGTITGNEPESGNAASSFQELKRRYREGEQWQEIKGQIVIEEDWTLEFDWAMDLLEGAELIVPKDVTLTVVGYLGFFGGGITVEEGGNLIVNRNIGLEESGFLHVDGSYDGNGLLFVDLDRVSVYGVPESKIHALCDVTGEMGFMVLLGAGYHGLHIRVKDEVVLSQNVTTGPNDFVEIFDGGSITVPKGVTFTAGADVIVNGGTLTVEEGATYVNNQYLYVEAGRVVVKGTYTGEGNVYAYFRGDQTRVEGIDHSLMEVGIDFVTDEETLRNAMESDYRSAYVRVTGNITLTRDLRIPENFGIVIGGFEEEGAAAYARAKTVRPSITVPADVKLTVEGDLDNYGDLIIEEQAELVNSGKITTAAGTVLVVEGAYSGSGTVSVSTANGTVVEGLDNSNIHTETNVTNLEELQAVLDAGYAGGSIFVVGEIVMTEDVIIPETFEMVIFEMGSITVTDDASFVLGGQLYQMDGAAVVVKSGATMEIQKDGFYDVQSGLLRVEKGANFLFHENLSYIWGQSEIVGIDPGQLTMRAFVWDGQSLEEALENSESLGAVYVYPEDAILEVDRDITLAPNTTLVIEGTQDTHKKVMVYENAILTNKGTIVLGEFGTLEIRSEATLNNAGDIRMEGGELVQDENSNLWGDEPVTGKTEAQIGDVTYATVAEALKAAKSGDVVQLVADAEVEGTVSIPVGVTLNLGGYSLTADYVIGFNGSFLTGTPEMAKLIVPKDNIILGKEGYKNEKGQYVLPIWDPASDCFQFSLFVANTATSARGLYLYEEEEKIYFRFKHQATAALNDRLLSDGAGDNGLSIVIRLIWTNSNGTASQDFYYNDRQIGLVTGKNDYTFTLTGYKALNLDLSTLVVQALIISDSGATAFGTEWTQANAK